MANSRHAWVAFVAAIISMLGWYGLYARDYKLSGTWGCEMSWMTPSYALIDLPRSSVARYRLYLYRENGWDGPAEQLTGHPVIFIPGNAGSYQQVRSIASSTSRQYHGHPGHIADGMVDVVKPDIFTLDLNEDFSAFNGRLLQDQAAFLADAVRHVVSLYGRPPRITLVGHSMGGIVSRLALTLGIEEMVDVLVTLSTPHLLPPVTLDSAIIQVYRDIDSPSPVPIISICGGTADSQIASDSCIAPTDSRGFTIFTTGLPGAWTGVDHQAMVWCHQIRWRVARTLLELTRHHTEDAKVEAARRWLMPGHEPIAPATADVRSFDIKEPTSFVMSTPPSSIEMCREGQCVPVHLDIHALPKIKPDSPFPLPGEGVGTTDLSYSFVINDTGSLRLGLPHSAQVHHGAHVVETVRSSTWSTTRRPAQSTLHYPTWLTSSLLSYRLAVTLGTCDGRLPLIRHKSSSSRADVIEERFFPANAPILLHSHISSAPYIPSKSQGFSLDIYQTPSCPVQSITVRLDLLGMLAKAFTRYRMTVLAWSLGWCGVLGERILASQARSAGQPSKGQTFDPVLAIWRSPQTILRVVLVILAGGMCQIVTGHDFGLLLGVSDLVLLPLHLFLAAITLALVLGVSAALHGLRTVVRCVYQREARAPTSLRRVVIIAGLWIAAGMVVPQDILAVILVVWLIFRYTTEASPVPTRIRRHDADWIQDEPGLVHWILLLAIFMLPYPASRLLGDIRAALVGWRDYQSANWFVLDTVPLLGLSLLAGPGTTLDRDGSRRVDIVRGTMLASAAMSFVAGTKWLHLVHWPWEISMLAIWVLFRS